MTQKLVQQKIEGLGHRIAFDDSRSDGFRVNIDRDKKGEFFDFHVAKDIEMAVLDTEGDHALVLFRIPHTNPHQPHFKERILIGHDERQLFIAGISEGAGVSTINQAKQSLKPTEVQEYEKEIGVKNLHARKAKGRGLDKRLRQGDFFFVPRPDLDLSKEYIHKKEPIGRTGGSNHICDELARVGGEDIYVPLRRDLNITRKQSFTETEYKALLEENPKAQFWAWNIRRGGRTLKVYVRGGIRHHEHQTLTLREWHEVISNTELDSGSSVMRNIMFLD